MESGLDETARRERLERMRPADWDRELFHDMHWSDHDIDRLRAAFKKRFDEDIPRTETLMAVAAEGIRIYVEKHKAGRA